MFLDVISSKLSPRERVGLLFTRQILGPRPDFLCGNAGGAAWVSLYLAPSGILTGTAGLKLPFEEAAKVLLHSGPLGWDYLAWSLCRYS